MAFFKKIQIKSKDKNGQPQTLWFPRSVLVGGKITTDQLAKRIAQESTVAPADVRAVLTSLSSVMGEYMSLGRSVKLDGIGSFYFSANSQGNGAESEKKCSAKQIKAVKVNFLPETTYRRSGSGRQAVRALTDVDIEWIDITTLGLEETEGEGGQEPGGVTPDTPVTPGGGSSGGSDNPGGGGADDPNNDED